MSVTITAPSPRRSLGRVLLFVALAVLGLLFTIPMIWAVLSALKTPQELAMFPPRVLPERPVWSNFIQVWSEVPFFSFLQNTLIVAVLSVIGDILTAVLVAYGFSRFRFPGRDMLFLLVISTLLLPPEVTLIPQFIMFKWAGLLDTLTALIIPSYLATSAFSIFLMRQFFLTLPRDLDEAAMIDGAGSLRILWQILMPLAKPGITTVALFSFLFHWNDFIRPLIFLNSAEKFTLSLGLRFFQKSVTTGGGLPQDNLLMAAAVMMTLPVMLLFFFSQRYFIQGSAMAGIKR
jgi:multiple sugar transport system permease protein